MAGGAGENEAIRPDCRRSFETKAKRNYLLRRSFSGFSGCNQFAESSRPRTQFSLCSTKNVNSVMPKFQRHLNILSSCVNAFCAEFIFNSIFWAENLLRILFDSSSPTAINSHFVDIYCYHLYIMISSLWRNENLEMRIVLFAQRTWNGLPHSRFV